MLKIRYSDDRLPPFWAIEKTFSIGRSKSNHLSVDDPDMDDVHARIINRGDVFILKDAGSKNGTYVNGTRVTQKNIGCGDAIQLGNLSLEVVDPLLEQNNSTTWSLIADSSWLSGHEFPLRFDQEKTRVVLGRSNECDIVIPGTHLSRQHAEIVANAEGLQIRDLKSSNGTFVNDKKVEASRLKAGDRIRVDVYSFKVFGPGIALPRAATQTMKAITDEMIEVDRTDSVEKLWKTKATSPGNRTQEDLYKKNWLPLAVALSLVGLFIGATAYFFLTL